VITGGSNPRDYFWEPRWGRSKGSAGQRGQVRCLLYQYFFNPWCAGVFDP